MTAPLQDNVLFWPVWKCRDFARWLTNYTERIDIEMMVEKRKKKKNERKGGTAEWIAFQSTFDYNTVGFRIFYADTGLSVTKSRLLVAPRNN